MEEYDVGPNKMCRLPREPAIFIYLRRSRVQKKNEARISCFFLGFSAFFSWFSWVFLGFWWLFLVFFLVFGGFSWFLVVFFFFSRWIRGVKSKSRVACFLAGSALCRSPGKGTRSESPFDPVWSKSTEVDFKATSESVFKGLF